MRFFKAFNILHRRTKSATFVPGPPLDYLAPPPPTTRCSSASYSLLPASRIHDATTTTTSIFDMVISQAPLITPQVNHLADSTLPYFWNMRRQSARASLASIQSAVDKEHSRLKDAVAFWSHEHSKLCTSLNNCQADLFAERQKNLALQRKTELDARIIMDLRNRLTQHATSAVKTELLTGNPASNSGVLPIDVAIAITPDSSVTFPDACIPTKLPTIQEYSNALRLTLSTRKELRDQKKVAKFWKRRASLTVEDQQDIITPSASAISSIHETLPAERQAALHTLMMRRGLTSKLAGLVKSPLSEDCGPRFDVTLPILPPSSSKSSVDSRLPPLASESMKAEINLLFGSWDGIKLLAPLSHKGRDRSASISTLEISKKPSPLKAPALKLHHPGSTANAAEFFSLGQNTLPEIKIEEDNVAVNDVTRQPNVVNNLGAYEQPLLQGLSSWSSSFMHIPALSSGSPANFGQELLSASKNDTLMVPNPSMRQASKECTSHRSWQHYTLTKSSRPNGTIGGVLQTPTKQAIAKMGNKQKENNQASSTLPVCHKKHSRLPVPAFTRN